MEEAATAKLNSAQDGGPSYRLAVARGRPHTLRHLYARHLRETGYDIRTIRELLGQNEVSTTNCIYRESLIRKKLAYG